MAAASDGVAIPKKITPQIASVMMPTGRQCTAAATFSPRLGSPVA